MIPKNKLEKNNGKNWLTYGRTHSEQRYSPLDEINVDSISRLGLAWSLDMPDARHLVSTTLAVDGVLYVTSSFSIVTAVRQTSVVFAALLSMVMLSEKPGPARIAGSVLTALGVAVIAL